MDLLDELTICLENSQHNKRNVASFNVASAIPIAVMQMVNEFVWTLEDTAAFVGGRVAAAMRRYLDVLLPPLAAALMKFNQAASELAFHRSRQRLGKIRDPRAAYEREMAYVNHLFELRRQLGPF